MINSVISSAPSMPYGGGTLFLVFLAGFIVTVLAFTTSINELEYPALVASILGLAAGIVLFCLAFHYSSFVKKIVDWQKTTEVAYLQKIKLQKQNITDIALINHDDNDTENDVFYIQANILNSDGSKKPIEAPTRLVLLPNRNDQPYIKFKEIKQDLPYGPSEGYYESIVYLNQLPDFQHFGNDHFDQAYLMPTKLNQFKKGNYSWFYYLFSGGLVLANLFILFISSLSIWVDRNEQNEGPQTNDLEREINRYPTNINPFELYTYERQDRETETGQELNKEESKRVIRS